MTTHHIKTHSEFILFTSSKRPKPYCPSEFRFVTPLGSQITHKGLFYIEVLSFKNNQGQWVDDPLDLLGLSLILVFYHLLFSWVSGFGSANSLLF